MKILNKKATVLNFRITFNVEDLEKLGWDFDEEGDNMRDHAIRDANDKYYGDEIAELNNSLAEIENKEQEFWMNKFRKENVVTLHVSNNEGTTEKYVGYSFSDEMNTIDSGDTEKSIEDIIHIYENGFNIADESEDDNFINVETFSNK